MSASSKKAAYPRPHFGFLLVFTLILTSFVPLSLGLSCAGIFFTSVSDHLGVGTGMSSYYTSILWFSTLVSLPLLGRLLAKADARLCISGAITIIAVDFIWLSFVSELWQFYVGAFIMGIGVTMLLFLAPSTLVNRWFAKKAGFLIGLIMAFTGIGGVVWSFVGGILINEIGWSATYLVFGALSLLTLPAGIFLIASRPQDKGLAPYGADVAPTTKNETSEESGTPAQVAFKTPVFYLLLALCFCLNFGMYVYFMIPSYVNALPVVLSMPLLGATASSVAMAGQTISKILLGYAGDRAPHAGASVGVVLGLVGVTLFALGGSNALIIYLASFAFGFFYGVTNVMMPILTIRAFGNRDYPKIYARVSMAASISGALTGFIWGTLIDIFGGFTVMFVGVALFMIVAVGLVSVLAAIDRRRASSSEEITAKAST